MDTMKQEDLEYFRMLLTERLNELLKHADSTVTGMTQPKENFADPTDRALMRRNEALNCGFATGSTS